MDRGEISRRLKAARWLAGGRNENGQVSPLSPEDLAKRDLLAVNGISANRIYEIEQERITARPMELEKIAVALGVSADWFLADAPSDDDLSDAAEMLAPQLLAAAQALRRARESAQRGTGEQGRPEAEGGAGA
jgi:transcriptional regulator with XRE-family HTH domain